MMRRVLVIADVAGLTVAFLTAEAVMRARGWAVDYTREVPLFAATLPVWVLVARMYGLYDRDEERTDHSTLDDLVGVFHLVTVGAWVLYVGMWLIGLKLPPLEKVFNFWIFTVAAIVATRAAARTVARALPAYRQRTVIVGAGEIGQLVGRKYRQHPEYGIDVVGFVDDDPKELRRETARIPLLGSPRDLPHLVSSHHVDRTIFAFTADDHGSFLAAIRSLDGADVEIDVVPRLFEVMTPVADVRTVEGIPLLGFTPRRATRAGRAAKRAIDVVGSSLLLLLVAPLFALAAAAIKLDSSGPVFFRQERLGRGMEPFSMLKFRTMTVDTDQSLHREYVKTVMDIAAAPETGNLYKLDQAAHVTRVGRWLRRLSLDELPQFVNVLKGDMSLVGPRPCLRYETDLFEPHHFVRFSVPAGVTGLWQVTARARTTFKEALDLDVTYVRSWSLGLDLRLICRTPLKILKGDSTT
jgi:exopolysaccharide biosynthesis polyprenyl glycosylphosphotransferase